jgi:hypothetical protein
MQVFCPQCAAANEVGSSASAARCSSCGAALPVHMPAYGPPDGGARPQAFGIEDMAAVPKVVPPKISFVWSEQQLPGGAWGVFVGGRSGAGVLWVILAVGGVVLASGIWGGADGDPTVAVVLIGVLSLFFAYRGLCWAVNRSVLRVDQDWLTMGRGPVPQLGSVRVPTATIAVLRPLKLGSFKTGTTVNPYFGVQVMGGDGSTSVLPIQWMPREQASYACERLNMMVRDVQKRAGILAPQLPQQQPF